MLPQLRLRRAFYTNLLKRQHLLTHAQCQTKRQHNAIAPQDNEHIRHSPYPSNSKVRQKVDAQANTWPVEETDRRDESRPRRTKQLYTRKLSPIDSIQQALFPDESGKCVEVKEGLLAATNHKDILEQLSYLVEDKSSTAEDVVFAIKQAASVSSLSERTTYRIFSSLKSTQSATPEHWKELLRTLNGATAQLRSLHQEPHLKGVISAGLYVACRARSVASFEHYMKLAVAIGHVPASYVSILWALENWVKGDDFAGWEGQRRHQGLVKILTSYEQGSFPFLKEMPSRCRQPFLYALAQMCDGPTIYKAWDEFRGSDKYGQCLQLSIDSTQDKALSLSLLVHHHIEALLIAGSPELAWRLANSIGWRPDLFVSETWSVLLDYPEYITKWKEEMAEPLLRKYEESVQRIEDTLGIQWTGGEDGEHVLVDDEGEKEHIFEGFLTMDSNDRNVS